MVTPPVYMDYNATTPCDTRVVEAMLPYFTRHYGNAASRSHAYGWQAEEAVSIAREQVANLIGAQDSEIIFTSGATEAVNLALKGAFEAYTSKGNHIITVQTEHKAVLDTCRHIEQKGGEVSLLRVNNEGLIDLEELQALIRPTTILIAVMYANNETGVLQPIKQIGELAKKNSILFFSDASQAIGKIPVNVLEDGIDLLAMSAHKCYGPKGVGALYVRRRNPRVSLKAQIDGGGHERGLRSGTLNVPGIVGMGKACELASENDASRMSVLRDKLETSLLEEGIKINGSREKRLPHVTNISFKDLGRGTLLGSITKELAVSSGSACTSALMEPSYVLKAMGVDDELAYNSIRFSLGKESTEEEVDFAIKAVKEKLSKLKQVPSV